MTCSRQGVDRSVKMRQGVDRGVKMTCSRQGVDRKRHAAQITNLCIQGLAMHLKFLSTQGSAKHLRTLCIQGLAMHLKFLSTQGPAKHLKSLCTQTYNAPSSSEHTGVCYALEMLEMLIWA
eukprot:1142653-Pelagomonas_calceolata.AAC.1